MIKWWKRFRTRMKERKYDSMVVLMHERGMLNKHVVDSLHGPVQTIIDPDLKWFVFNGAKVGVDIDQDPTRISLWVHEFTEQIIGYLILDMLVEDRIPIDMISKTVDGISMYNPMGGVYKPTPKHIMTALHTISHIDDLEVTGDEYAAFFNIEKIEQSKLDELVWRWAVEKLKNMAP